MTYPVQISFRNLAHSPAIEELILKKASKLQRFSPHIISCRIVVEVPHRHHEHGNLYNVGIDLSVKGRELVANRNNHNELEHKEIQAAVNDAVDAAERQLEEYLRLRRGS